MLTNLNKFGQPINSPITRSPYPVPWRQKQTQNIQSRKIKTSIGNLQTLETEIVTATSATLGSLFGTTTLGPTGAIASSGTNILDHGGLISTNNFRIGGASSNSQQTTTNTSPVDVTGSSQTIVLSRNAQVLTIATGFGYNSTYVNSSGNYTGDKMNLQLIDSIQGTLGNVSMGGIWTTSNISIDFVGQTFGYSLNTQDEIVTFESLFTWSPGTHTAKLQFNTIGGGTAILDNFEWVYIILGT